MTLILDQKTDKKRIGQLPRAVFEGDIRVVDTLEGAEKAVRVLQKADIVGVDTETRPSFKKGVSHKVALLQISTERECFLIRLNKIGMPECVRDFLAGDVLKVGLSLKDDFMMLRRRRMSEDAEAGRRPSPGDGGRVRGDWVELQDYVERFGILDKGLAKLYANLFDMKISKAQQLSNWEADRLTEAQQKYAATDAWACIKIFKRLRDAELSGDYKVVPVVS